MRSIPVNIELFRRTAPQWNCIDYPGEGMHYMANPDKCAWCGKTRAQIAPEYDRLEEIGQ